MASYSQSGLHIKWPLGPTKVQVIGTFNGWGDPVELTFTEQGFETVIADYKADEGDKVVYKFITDGNYVIDESAPQDTDEHGNVNNYFVIPKLEEEATSETPSSVPVTAVAADNTTIPAATALATESTKEISEDVKEDVKEPAAPTESAVEKAPVEDVPIITKAPAEEVLVTTTQAAEVGAPVIEEPKTVEAPSTPEAARTSVTSEKEPKEPKTLSSPVKNVEQKLSTPTKKATTAAGTAAIVPTKVSKASKASKAAKVETAKVETAKFEKAIEKTVPTTDEPATTESAPAQPKVEKSNLLQKPSGEVSASSSANSSSSFTTAPTDSPKPTKRKKGFFKKLLGIN